MKILIRYYPIFLIFVVIALVALPLVAQDATPEPACQTYRLTVEQGRVRSDPSEAAAVIGGVNRFDTLCIQGVADNNLPWLLIRLQDDEGNSRQGYISNTIVEPGEPGQITDPEAYCDGYRVIPDEAIVRAGPSTTFAIVGTFVVGDIICVEDYVYQYYGWANVYQPDGASGWVNRDNVNYQYDEDLACPNEESYVVSTAAILYSAPARSSATSSRFAVGTGVCLTAESEEENSWVTFTMPDREGRTGWMVIDLLEPIEDNDDLTVGQVATGTPLPATEPPATGGATSPIEACVMYRVDSPEAARIRAQPSTNSTQIGSLGNSEIVCVLGTDGSANDWYRVNLTPDAEEAQIGYIFGSLLEPVETGDATAVAQTDETEATTAVVQADETEATTVDAQVADVSPTATTTPTLAATAIPNIVPTATPDGELPIVAQICPVGAQPINPSACVTATPTSIPGLPELSGNGLLLARDVTLTSLFVPSLDLASPESSIDFFFRLPADWVLGTPTVMMLSVDYSQTIIAQQDNTTVTNLASRFDVRVDDILVGTISLSEANIGRQILQIPIPDSIIRDSESRFHTVEFTLSSREQCRVSVETRLVINAAESAIRFVYEETQPVLDFAFYPLPFYNEPIGGEVEAVIFVLPANPSRSDLQAAASVAAGLGQLTSDELQLRFTTASDLTPEQWQTMNLILIGGIEEHIQIRDLYRRNVMPSTWDGNALTIEGDVIETDEGLIHLVANPDNPDHAILVITGQSGTAVERAGQALGGRPSILGITGNTGVVFESRALARATGLNTDSLPGIYLLGDLNNGDDIVLNGIGTQSVSLDFDVPLGGDIREDAYIEIIYNSASLLDNSSSTLTLMMNGVPIASASLQRDVTEIQTTTDRVTNEDFRTLRAEIPAGIVDSGELNNLTIITNVEGGWGCDIPSGETIWVTIAKDSLIFLPQEQSTASDFYHLMEQFPRPYNIYPDLSDMLISMPDTITDVEGTQLLELMSFLGEATRFGEGFRPVIRLGAIDEDSDYFARFNILVLGRPTNNAFLSALNAMPPPQGTNTRQQSLLPQPFAAGTDEFVQVLDDVSYRLRNRSAVGVLQVLASPWNVNKRLTIISGTEPLGQMAASVALLDAPFGRAALDGDVVFATFDNLSAVDTRTVFDPLDILSVVPEIVGAPAVGLPTTTPLLVGTSTGIPTSATPTSTIDPLIRVSPTPTDTATPFPTATSTVFTDATTPGNTGPDIVLILIGISVVIVIIGGAYTIYLEVRPKR